MSSSSANYFQRTHASTRQPDGTTRIVCTRVGPGQPIALFIRRTLSRDDLWTLRFDDVSALQHAAAMSHRASTRTPLGRHDGVRFDAGPGAVWIVSPEHGALELRGDELAGLERALAEIARIRGAA